MSPYIIDRSTNLRRKLVAEWLLGSRSCADNPSAEA
jgi:hypothetical protein